MIVFPFSSSYIQGPFIVGQVGLLTLGYLQFQCTDETCALPGPIQNILSAYAATWIAMLVEVLSGLPSPISVIPVLFIFAPGSSAVLAIVGQMHSDLGDTIRTNKASWDDLATQAFSYGVGIYLAQETWKPFLKGKFKSRRRAAILREREQQQHCQERLHQNNHHVDKNNVDNNNDYENCFNEQVANGVDTTAATERAGSSLESLRLDLNFHSPQTAVHGTGYRNRVKEATVFKEATGTSATT